MRHNFIRMIRKGKLDQLKEFLENNPSFLTKEIAKYQAREGGNAVDTAISFNQPEIIKYLVTEKGFNLPKEGAPYYLNIAARKGSYEAVVALLDLGVNPKQRNYFGDDAWACSFASKDHRLQELLLPYHKERLQEEKLAAEQREQKAREAAEARIAGTWTLFSPSELIHEHQPEGHGPITDVFNLATSHMFSVETLDSGKQDVGIYSASPSDSMFVEAAAKAKEIIAQQQPPKNQPAKVRSLIR